MDIIFKPESFSETITELKQLIAGHRKKLQYGDRPVVWCSSQETHLRNHSSSSPQSHETPRK